MDILTRRSLADIFKNLFFAIVSGKRNPHNHVSIVTPTGTADTITTIERFQLAKDISDRAPMDKTALFELSYRRSRASCVGLDVSRGKSPADRCTSNQKMRQLEPKLDRGDGVSGAGDGGSNGKIVGFSERFLLRGDYGEEQAFKGISQQALC
ncbi:hypothetical protein DY000_02033515 [Brassica cretica]|uniref:Uncharacterized protein n=1 Tax=Brassica cretica TaxID=69181 RepID=A0ABQ7DX76_BRACR|nr:hypothetical protein DY000_02033515 [Brassica cretica]